MSSALDLITCLFLFAIGFVWWRVSDDARAPPAERKEPSQTFAIAGLMEAGIPIPAEPQQQRPLDSTLRQIAMRGAYKSEAAFLTEAKAAYEAIVAAFAGGAIDSIAHFLTPAIREDFEQHVRARKQRGETEETIFIGFRAAEIVAAAIEGDLVWIEVRFVADMVSATRDASGRVIAGDSIHVAQCAERWTFELQTRQARSVWLLSATESDETVP
jgi:predicted lipid-binding transport protein (Tim44 family)